MKKRTKKGFTLIELIVVIAILAVLAVIAVPVVTGIVSDAHVSASAANARTLELAIKATMTKESVSVPANVSGAAMTAFGLSTSEITNNNKYQMNVDANGNVTGTVNTGGIIYN